MVETTAYVWKKGRLQGNQPFENITVSFCSGYVLARENPRKDEAPAVEGLHYLKTGSNLWPTGPARSRGKGIEEDQHRKIPYPARTSQGPVEMRRVESVGST